MKVICVSGKARAGKDTYAGYLADELRLDGYKVLIVHYADLLKFVCKQMLGWDGEKDEHGRWLLQYVGTDIIRKQSSDFFAYTLMCLLDYLKEFAGWDFVLIPDARFKNEIDCVKEFDFPMFHFRVERDGCDSGLTEAQRNHPSETSLDNATYDLIIDNNGTLRDLQDAAETTVVWMTGFHQTRMEEFR